MSYNRTVQYALMGGHASTTYTATQTFFYGSPITQYAGGAGTFKRIYLPTGGVITQVNINWYLVAGTNEATSCYLRKNNTTDTTLSTTLDFSSTSVHLEAPVSVPVVKGDYVEVKIVCPNYVTAPSSVQCQVMILVATGH